jgi:HAD superfamily hydrolase (TIGR01509 family)
MIQAVFWDSDNTLVETAEHHWHKHFETLKAHGIALHDAHREKIYTNNGAQNWEWITAELGLKLSQADYLAQIDRWYMDHIKEIKIRSGVVESIALFKSKNIPQAVVSNGRRNSVHAALDAKNMSRDMAFILCKEDYEGRKPDPAPYLAALKKMEEVTKTTIKPANCLVIEDDPLGVESAHRAGMKVIHRKFSADQAPSNQAFRTLFSANDLITVCKQLTD